MNRVAMMSVAIVAMLAALRGAPLAAQSAPDSAIAPAPASVTSPLAAAGDTTDVTPSPRDTLGILISPAGRFPELRIGLDAVSIWQNLEQSNAPDTLAELSHGFQAAVGNLHIAAALAEGIDVYVEFYLSSKQHAGQLFDREGWVNLSKLPEKWNVLNLNRLLDHIDVKAGHFEVDFGNQHLRRSDNAQVQKNPLIGNFIVDPNTVEAGLEVIGTEGLFHWLVGYGDGVTVESFLDGRGNSFHSKVWLQPTSRRYNLAASVYQVDHSETPIRSAKGTWDELFAGNRSGSRYSGVLVYPAVNNQLASEAGQINLGQGKDELAWQLDAEYDARPLWLYAQYGRLKDSDINGSDPGKPEEKWSYWGAEAKLDVLPDALYVAGRYSRASTEKFQNIEMDAFTDRVQLGLGYRLIDQMLFKIEYVTQRFDGFTVGYTDDPKFDGVLIEGSVSF